MNCNLAESQNTVYAPKKFQEKTINRVCNRFLHSIHRVLVADEVGLGKTIIAQGVIKKMSEHFFSDEKNINETFKVVYICSNQIIARQNVKKLDLDNTFESEDMRLSLQSLKLHEARKKKTYEGKIQVIPLTPYTSFKAESSGTKEERAYIYAVLQSLLNKENLENKRLSFLKTNYVTDIDSWNAKCNSFVSKIDDKLIIKIKKYLNIKKILNSLRGKSDTEKIIYLRKQFADMGINMLRPNLIIMDEFQRFKELLDAKEDESTSSETSMLVNAFFDKTDMDILLLSATPYKMYSSNQEIEMGLFNHKSEFDSVINFLLGDKKEIFEKYWDSYADKLNNLDSYTFEEIKKAKSKVEKIMFENICRTERNSVMDDSSFIDDQSFVMSLSKEDVNSYKAIGNLVKETEIKKYLLNVDFVKSCPFLMSFMQDYELKKQITNRLKTSPSNLIYANNELLWIKKETIEKYEPVSITNSKYNNLLKLIFNEDYHLENLLWIPPSKPYYKLARPFDVCNTEEYQKNPLSKFLIFSAWEMVPRMISTLISYESERLVYNKNDNRDYFKDYKPRFLDFITSSEKPYLYTLLYPSKFLADLYNPVDFIDKSQAEIKPAISALISNKLQDLGFSFVEEEKDGKKGKKGEHGWYSLLPMFIDNNCTFSFSEATHYKRWYDSLKGQEESEDNLYITHLFEVNIQDKMKLLHKDRLPSDIVNVLTDMALGSPAVCMYRTLRDDSVLDMITEASNRFCRYLNSRESVYTIKHVYKLNSSAENEDIIVDRKGNKTDYWKYVIKYCKNGCFQSMFDEFYDLQNGKDNKSKLKDVITALIPVKTSYVVDTYSSYKRDILSNEVDNSKELRIASNFAVSFTKGKSNDKDTNRKEKVRNAFNSPIRPFVLTTTSIGQEGLDFHNYCREIIHWNLPSNPIDLEQREGRINRYKCLSVRQSIAKEFGNKIKKSNTNIITQLNNLAELSRPHDKMDLYPFWVLGTKQSIPIKRIIFQYPLSIDEPNYEKLKTVLSLYRLTIGQPNQEELIEYFEKKRIKTQGELRELTINLCPSRGSFF